MQSKSSLWKRRCGRNHGFEMFHGSWALRWLQYDDSLHTKTKMRHKRIKRSCKNWVIVYPYSRVAVIVKCWLTRWALMMGIDESFSLVSSRGSCWVIMVSEKFGDMLDLICFVRSIYRSQPMSIFHPFLVGETVQLDQAFEIAVIKFPALQTRLWRFFPIL